jgi:2-polyprenyl-6-methoxyphenol hydroxylase-like FAD-dependent oxidoreductase
MFRPTKERPKGDGGGVNLHCARAIVIGGGIGGLAAGIALTQAGWDVRVLERRAQPHELGAGISLWPNALTALDRLGVWPDIRSSASMELGGARKPDGQWLSRLDGGARPPFEILLVHRAQLHAELTRTLPAGVLVARPERSTPGSPRGAG